MYFPGDPLDRLSGDLAAADGVEGAASEQRAESLLDNRFGQYYAPGGTKDLSSAVVVKGAAGHQRRLGGAQPAANARRKK